MSKTGILTLAIATTIAFAPLTRASAMSNPPPDEESGPSKQDNAALRAQAQVYAKAFAAGDAAALANMWTEDGTFLESDGVELRGRSAIQKHFETDFRRDGKQPLEVTVDSIIFPANNVAIEKGTTRLPDSMTDTVGKYTVVHIKQNGQWLMQNVSEINWSPPSTAEDLKEWGWLVGNWTAHGKGTMHLQAHYAGHNKFIVCQFSGDGHSENDRDDIEIIGWSPITEHLACWHFDSRGGVGFGKWIKSGQTWIERAKGMQPDGSICRATYILKKTDNNTFQWQSVNRTINGAAVPDTQSVTVTRDQ